MREAVEGVFSTMLDTVATLVEPCEGSDGSACPEDRIDVEAVVEFHGEPNGAVVLRATTEGAADIARKLLMMEDGESVEFDEIKDALGECANMVTGSLKTRALDPCGNFQLGTPTIDTRIHVDHAHHSGRLVFSLGQGNFAVEIWLSEAAE
ncbi:MAG: chemotaxis protein CheX [Planctomycetes bacterium]|nr:chemotaxis protein CheX [Planctomycetota bacterium]